MDWIHRTRIETLQKNSRVQIQVIVAHEYINAIIRRNCNLPHRDQVLEWSFGTLNTPSFLCMPTNTRPHVIKLMNYMSTLI